MAKKASDEDVMAGCAGAIMVASVVWIIFIGWMIFEIVNWITSK